MYRLLSRVLDRARSTGPTLLCAGLGGGSSGMIPKAAPVRGTSLYRIKVDAMDPVKAIAVENAAAHRTIVGLPGVWK